VGGYRVGNGEKTTNEETPSRLTEGFSFDPVVTIGLGGLRDLSEGLAT
jgi:hypothetical protein